jgi:ubiquinol-cytochrome c reductase cytochrome b subunit
MKFFSQEKVGKNPLMNFVYSFGISYPTPSNLSYYFNFGFIAMMCLVIQIFTGIFLAMYYCADTQLAF